MATIMPMFWAKPGKLFCAALVSSVEEVEQVSASTELAGGGREEVEQEAEEAEHLLRGMGRRIDPGYPGRHSTSDYCLLIPAGKTAVGWPAGVRPRWLPQPRWLISPLQEAPRRVVTKHQVTAPRLTWRPHGQLGGGGGGGRHHWAPPH